MHQPSGDREFLQTADRLLRGEARWTAGQILKGVWAKDVGDLRRGTRLNFKNTPDNSGPCLRSRAFRTYLFTFEGNPSTLNRAA